MGTIFYNVKAIIDSKEVSLPFNLNSIYQIFPLEFAKKLEWLLIDNYWYGKRLVVKELLDAWDKDLKFLWNFVFEKVFEWYTKKQRWLTSEEIDPSILSRVPVLISRDDSYFQDEYQAIPSKWYTEMMNNIIKNANLEVKLNTDFKNLVWLDYDKLIYTWPIDEYFDYKFWKLPYRSLSFEFRKYNRIYFQSWPQINYPCNHDFTRIVEYKYYLKEQSNQTIVSYEYPQEYIQEKNEPYYPFINDESVKMYGVEATGMGIETTLHAASMAKGEVGVLHGSMMHVLQDKFGQITEPYSISAGLDYPGVGPEHSFFRDLGRATYHGVTDKEAIAAFQLLCQVEGIIPALESSHAIAYAIKLAKEMQPEESMIVCLSGRGDKDVDQIRTYLKGGSSHE